MTIRRVRIWLSRGWYRTLCSISLLLLPLFCNTGRAFAAISHVQQDTIKSAVVVSGTKPQAGDIISGTICDENGPMQLVNITERDSLYRIVAHAVSDVNGKFAFKLVNPANRLSVTYVGYGEAITAITGTSFDITMVELPDLPVVDLSGDAKRVTMYGPPAVNYNRYYDPNAQPAVRDFIEIGARTPDVSVMYGVPRPVLEKENLSGGDEMTEAADSSELADSTAAFFDSIRLDTEYLRTHMRLRNGILPPVSKEEYAPLIIYDGNPVEVDKEKYAAFDWDKDIYSKKKVAALLGVKKKAVKASRVVTDRTYLVAIWGSKGRNGTFEVISYDAGEYNRRATNNFFQPLK